MTKPNCLSHYQERPWIKKPAEFTKSRFGEEGIGSTSKWKMGVEYCITGLRSSLVTHQADTYLCFCSILLPPPSPAPWMGVTGLPPALSSPVPIHSHGWRGALWKYNVLTRKNTTKSPQPGLYPRPIFPKSFQSPAHPTS